MAKVPTIDTGTASRGIIEARQVCKNTITTSTTNSTASSSVTTTFSIEVFTKRVGSYTMLYSTPGGKLAFNFSIFSRTLFDNASALAVGDWKIAIAIASLLFSRLRKE